MKSDDHAEIWCIKTKKKFGCGAKRKIDRNEEKRYIGRDATKPKCAECDRDADLVYPNLFADIFSV